MYTISTPSTSFSESSELIPTIERIGQPNQPNVPPPNLPPLQQYDADQVWEIATNTVQRAIAAFAQGVKQQELAACVPHLILPPPALDHAPELEKSFIPKPKDYDGNKNKFHS